MSRSLQEMVASPITSVIKSKIRLWIEYALVAAVVALLALVVMGALRTAALKLEVSNLKGTVEKEQARVAIVEAVNVSQQEALERIQALREVDSEVLEDLSTDLDTLRIRDRQVVDRVAYLERTNEAVRKYLSTSLPAVGCVLDNSCAAHGYGGEGARPAEGADAGVHASPADAGEDDAGPGDEQ